MLERFGPVAYKLELPATIKAHNVFHVSALKPYKSPNEPERIPERPPPVVSKSDDEYEVEEILDEGKRRGKTEYLVLWKGYPRHGATWEPAHHLANAQEVLQDFLKSKMAPLETDGPNTGATLRRSRPRRRTRR